MDTAKFDLLIADGLIVDGSGDVPYRGDMAVSDGRIVAMGKVEGEARSRISAAGCIVTPGFVDIHTHYDGQAVWSDHLDPSSRHGVTTVVVGNCGVGFAPCRAEDRETLIDVMEGVEDIPEVVMKSGLPWSWESFPEFLDTLDRRPRDIDVAAYLPHSPLRVYVMGERGAAREEATAQDIARMREIVRGALDAGALGFATSRLVLHRTGSGRNIPSYQAAELVEIARELGEAGKGVIQMVLEVGEKASPKELELVERIAIESKRPVTFSLAQINDAPDLWRDVLSSVRAMNERGGLRVSAQVFPRPVGVLLGHGISANPFMFSPAYAEISALSPKDRAARLRDPATRETLIHGGSADPANPMMGIVRDFARIYPIGRSPDYEPAPSSSIMERARRAGVSPEEIAYDLLLEDDGNAMLLATLANYAEASLDPVLEMINHEDTLIGLGDGGAHYGLICDSSYPTFMLTHWVRDRNGERLPLERAVRAMTAEPAQAVGLCDRGRLAPGYKADINVINLESLALHAPEVSHDLPGGGHRLTQGATGYVATIVGGEPIRIDDRRTTNLPGRLIRGAQVDPAA